MGIQLPSYFSSPAAMSDFGQHSARVSELPTDLPELVKTVQGLMVHIFWAKRYGLELDETRQAEVQIRPLNTKLSRLLELEDAPLDQPRLPERRLVGNCRDFTLLLVSFLRAQGQPARARCGFGTYFMPGHYEDHWVAEVWDGTHWRQVDAQLDALQCGILGIQFDPFNLPEGAFLTGGQAWQICRAGKADPDDFGIFDMHGWNFIAGDLIRDALALRKFEILPWDFWEGMGPSLEDNPPASVVERVDRLAACTANFDTDPEGLWVELDNGGWMPPENWGD
jgi:hypothetical protein